MQSSLGLPTDIQAETTSAQAALYQKAERLAPFIGHTPLFEFAGLALPPGVRVAGKLEWQQFGGSVKSRPAYEIIRQAIADGRLTSEKVLLDASSGNTGIAYAAIGAALGIRVRLYLPENASQERKRLLKALGVEIVYTSALGGTDEGQAIAREEADKAPDTYFYADQYGNFANADAHIKGTAPEILEQSRGEITHFIAGIGTTGTFVGTSTALYRHDPGIRRVALQPDHGMHGLEGWKHLETTQRIPAIWDASLVDAYEVVSTEEAYEWMKTAACVSGLLLSPSSAANLAGAVKLARQLEEGFVVTVFPDNIEKYGEVMAQLF
jgi:cysteine synthase B